MEERIVAWLERTVARLQRWSRPTLPGSHEYYAPLWRRYTAVMLDGLGYAMLSMFLMIGVFQPIAQNFSGHGVSLIEQILLIVAAFLFVVAPVPFLSSWMLARNGQHNGQTPGKQAMGIQVRRDDNKPWTFRSAFHRQVVYKMIFPVLFFAVLGSLVLALQSTGASWTAVLQVLLALAAVGGLGAFMISPLFDDRRRGFHDRRLGCSVIVVNFKSVPSGVTRPPRATSKEGFRENSRRARQALRDMKHERSQKKAPSGKTGKTPKKSSGKK